LKESVSLLCLLLVPALIAIPGTAPADTPLCEVQDWEPSTGFSPLMGQTVTVTGYVTVGLGIYQETYTSIYIVGLGNDDCGVNVFSFERLSDVEVGDTIRVTGLVEEYVSASGYGATTELTFASPADVTILAKGDGTLPEPVVMATGDVGHESNEGKLVRVHAVVVSPFVDRGFEVDDGTGIIEIFDLPRNFEADPVWQSLTYGDEVIITGMVSQSDPEMPFLSDYSIIPRSPDAPYEDVKKKECIPGGTPGPELTVSGSIFAPEIGERVTIEYNGPHEGRMRLRVFDGKGRLAATLFDGQSVCGQQTIVWDGRNEVQEALSVGLYLITLTCEDPGTGAESMETVPVVIGRELR
jgi:hypothetical protein